MTSSAHRTLHPIRQSRGLTSGSWRRVRSGRSSDQQKERVNPGVLGSVRVTAGHHALVGQVVRRKRHRGEAYVVVEVKDGSRQLIAVRNTELADGRSSSPDLRFTPGSLRALVNVIGDCRERTQREGADAAALPEQPPGVGIAAARHMPAGRDVADRAAAAPAVSGTRARSDCSPRLSSVAQPPLVRTLHSSGRIRHGDE